MLFTLGLLLLLAPFPSFQTTTNDRKNSTGSDMIKPNVIVTLSKPKTSAALAKQTIRPSLKPNTVNQTVLPIPVANQKPPAVNPAVTPKNKPKPTVIQTTPSSPVKATTASGAVTNKDKHTASVNQTVLTKSPSVSNVKVTKDKPAPTGAPNVQSASTKSASASSAKTTKDKLQPLVNQTVSIKSPSIGDGKTAKDKLAPTVIQNVQSTSMKSALASGTKTTKNKLMASINQTLVVKSLSNSDMKNPKDKPAATVIQTPLSTPLKSITDSGSTADKDKVTASGNQTSVKKAPTSTTEKPAPAQPIKVVITDGCESSHTKEQELNLKPGTPLVMTHKISLLPGDCTGGCEAEMAALKGRVARLEKEMSSLKEKCPCSVNCPNGCSGNGECEKGKCVCQKGFLGPDCSKCAQGAECSKISEGDKGKVNKGSNVIKENVQEKNTKVELTLFEKRDQKKGIQAKETDIKPNVATIAKAVLAKTQAKLDASVKKINIKGSSSATKIIRPTIGQVLLKHEGRKQEEARKGKTTVLASKKVLQKPDLKLVKEGTASKIFPKSDRLKDEPQTNITQSNIKKSNGTAKIVTVLSKIIATNKTRTVKESTEQSTLADRTASKLFPKSDQLKDEPQTNITQSNIKKSNGTAKIVTVLSKATNKTRTVKESTQQSPLAGGTASKLLPKSDQLKDEPQTNITQSNIKKSNGTAKIVTVLSKATNKTRTVKETTMQSTLAEKNVTQSSGQKQVKKLKVDTVNVQTIDNRNTDAGKIVKEKVTQKSQYVVNSTITATPDEAQVLQNKTTTHVSGVSTRRTGGSGLGSVKVVNIFSYSFTMTWSAPQGMFKNFTVIRREPRAEGDEDEYEYEEFEEEALEGDKVFTAKNTTEVEIHSESMNTTVSSGKAVGSRGRAESKRITMVVPGSVRSVEFSNLRANTRYILHIYGTAAEKRSKIHRVIAITGPEPATDMVFSNVTESSLTVSWSKPKTAFTGFRVTYTHVLTGESRSVSIDSQQSHMVLSKLSAGSSYLITVTSTQGRAQSDSLTSTIVTVPAPPTDLQAVNVTDTRAVLQWTPSLGKVDRFIISYESSKIPNVTVTVMLSGNSVEHQLRGLQRGTLYTVKALSQKDSLQSTAISTTFTTANVVKASEVGPRSALIVWRTSTVVYHSYRLIYQVAGQETKELILEPTITEYKLTGLLPMSRYIVLVQGERDGRYTSVVTTEFITGKVRFPFPTECSQELLNGALQSGEVNIYPQGREGQAVRVYCDMETDGGGWTVFQRRMNGKTDFFKTWSEYRTGFGNLSEEFWLGNELLYNLTSIGPVSLRVDMRSGNDTAYAHYANFSIDSEERHYTLTVSSYTGTAGDSMRYHNGRPFSARDKDPDPLGIYCARAYLGGWWYKNCYKANLNGLYGTNSNNQGVVWIDWKGKDSSIPFTEMKFRPSRFSPATHG